MLEGINTYFNPVSPSNIRSPITAFCNVIAQTLFVVVVSLPSLSVDVITSSTVSLPKA